MTNIEKDSIARNRIVSETNMNFFVEAGAGSGKTTMLVSRMVAMVEAGIDISKICAITFTKAAAGEFYDRFQKQLIERSNPEYVWTDKGFAGQLPAPTLETRERCENALANIDLCFMGTIDSFCSMVLSEHPSEAGIPSDATIMSDEEAVLLYKQMYVKISAGEYGEHLKELARSFRMFHNRADEVFVEGESFFMNNRNVHFHYQDGAAINLDRLYAKEKADINKALACLLEHQELMHRTNKSIEAWEKLPKIIPKLSGRWNGKFSQVVSALKTLKELKVIPKALETYGYSLGTCFALGGAKGGWLDFAPSMDGGLYDKLNGFRYDVSMSFLVECVPIIEQAMRDKGAMTFFDYLYYLRNMLRRDAEGDGKLIHYIYDRHSYFLIDEFQDTNPMQAEVFFYLAATHPMAQWSACVPKPGSLFIVGDPKQSIYRFRSADVTSFLKVKKLFEKTGGNILYLSRNFRSTKQLTGYFNKVFSKLLPEETDVQSKFEEIPLPDKDKDEFQGIFQYTVMPGNSENMAETDPCMIGSIIERLVGRDDLIVSLEGESPRPIRYSDIMIITYGKSKIAPIVSELYSRDIPMHVEGSVPFGKNEALKNIYLLYHAVACPIDKRALYQVLKSDFAGLSEEEMMKFLQAGGDLSIKYEYEFGEEVHPTVLRVANHISRVRELYKRANKLSPAALFQEIMDQFEIYRIASVQNVEVIYYVLELLRTAEKNGTVVSIKDGDYYINSLLTSEQKEERCLSLTDSKDCVHIANLHKVKGLEAPIVILSACTQFTGSTASRIVHGDTSSEGYVFALQHELDNGHKTSYFETTSFADAKDAENMAKKAERDRLLYVAATRARNALIICDSLVGNASGGTSHKSIWKPFLTSDCKDIISYLNEKPVAIAEQKEYEDVYVSALYEGAKTKCVFNDRTSEHGSYRIENPSRARMSSKLSEEETVIVVSEENESKEESVHSSSEAHRFPTLLGTMVHRLMEIMISSKNALNVNKTIDEILREYRTPKNQPFELQLSQALLSVVDCINHGGYEQLNQAPKDIMAELLSADEVYCEVPFCYKDDEENQTIWNGVMDVVYRKGENWHIIDYKTNAEGTHLDEKYKAQLAAYRKAFKATTGYDADAHTYHIDI